MCTHLERNLSESVALTEFQARQHLYATWEHALAWKGGPLHLQESKGHAFHRNAAPALRCEVNEIGGCTCLSSGLGLHCGVCGEDPGCRRWHRTRSAGGLLSTVWLPEDAGPLLGPARYVLQLNGQSAINGLSTSTSLHQSRAPGCLCFLWTAPSGCRFKASGHIAVLAMDFHTPPPHSYNLRAWDATISLQERMTAFASRISYKFWHWGYQLHDKGCLLASIATV